MVEQNDSARLRMLQKVCVVQLDTVRESTDGRVLLQAMCYPRPDFEALGSQLAPVSTYIILKHAYSFKYSCIAVTRMTIYSQTQVKP